MAHLLASSQHSQTHTSNTHLLSCVGCLPPIPLSCVGCLPAEPGLSAGQSRLPGECHRTSAPGTASQRCVCVCVCVCMNQLCVHAPHPHVTRGLEGMTNDEEECISAHKSSLSVYRHSQGNPACGWCVSVCIDTATRYSWVGEAGAFLVGSWGTMNNLPCSTVNAKHSTP